uniref:Uncharacterized protein n=1 Tax=Panagrolaimus sp. ES5 TaxID=591445 RepID=A0AC34G8J4_9BILA
MCDTSGMTEIINQKDVSKEDMRCTFVFRNRTEEHKINIVEKNLFEYFDTNIKDSSGTHVVVGLTWGMNATTDIIIETEKETNKSEIKEKLEVSMGISGATFNQKLKKDNEETSKLTKIKFVTDVIMDTKIPENVAEAIEFINSLPAKIKEQNKNHVVEFRLMPLNVLKEHLSKNISFKLS